LPRTEARRIHASGREFRDPDTFGQRDASFVPSEGDTAGRFCVTLKQR
jgi:hypothetical protein